MKSRKTAILTLAAAAVTSASLAFASSAGAAVVPVVAGLTTDGTIYVAADDGQWHQVDSATLAALGLSGNTIEWYGELPGTIGDSLVGATAASRTTQATTAAPSAALAGLTTDGTVYMAEDDGLWHQIDSATLAKLGLTGNTIMWYGELPGTIGDPVPAA
jgi:hypothetical protein